MDPQQEFLVMLGKQIKRARQAQDMTQDQLAEKAGISRSMLNLIENGSNPTVATIYKIAMALKMGLDVQFFRV
ncbi:MAG: helix-turn-helix domain-containing protein [Bacteroidetes bacterium]|nr:helix-turn-helix domain-containing protein [Bacteroidota bacterium]